MFVNREIFTFAFSIAAIYSFVQECDATMFNSSNIARLQKLYYRCKFIWIHISAVPLRNIHILFIVYAHIMRVLKHRI
jgi:hypothetical protein